jgi:hypothetical protein
LAQVVAEELRAYVISIMKILEVVAVMVVMAERAALVM